MNEMTPADWNVPAYTTILFQKKKNLTSRISFGSTKTNVGVFSKITIEARN
ncbi:hypothetical protein GHT06_008102 [Daphnia sinensis]|uniref:Uncharacterized protein n=1 Tax=Daphnia sinensis TaxID=1820382 RepID=A0AAD5LUN5_9CRUS|nr:hypothetical protein GHT06_008102 [Daphnia sinensis]